MSRVSMNDKVNFQEFKGFLLSEIQENFPTIELYIVRNGDHVSNLIMEARIRNKRIQFYPYELWKNDSDAKIKTLLKLLNSII